MHEFGVRAEILLCVFLRFEKLARLSSFFRIDLCRAKITGYGHFDEPGPCKAFHLASRIAR